MRLIYRLAKDNLKRNSEIYLPYAISLILSVIFLFVNINLYYNKSLDFDYKYDTVKKLLMYTSYAIAGTSTIFNLYSNNFLSDQRKKDYGVYDILGFEKNHIRSLIFMENIILNAVSIFIGLIAGIVLDKLNFLILAKFLHFEETLKARISIKAILITIFVFLIITFISYLVMSFKFIKKDGLDLVKTKKNVKIKSFINIVYSVLGIIFIFAGYVLAYSIKLEKVLSEEYDRPLMLIAMIAVVFVIVGTYFLFQGLIVVSIAFLKNKNKIYRKNNNFIAISNLYFRLRENAIGLATICILSCMLLVTISMSIIAFKGITGDGRGSPYDLMLGAAGRETLEEYEKKAEKIIKSEGLAIENKVQYEILGGFGNQDVKNLKFLKGVENPYTDAISIEGYNLLFEDDKKIEDNELLVLGNSLYRGEDFRDKILKGVFLFDSNYKVKDIVDYKYSKYSDEFLDRYIIVVPKIKFDEFKNKYIYEYNENTGFFEKDGTEVENSPIQYASVCSYINIKGDEGKKIDFFEKYFNETNMFFTEIDSGEEYDLTVGMNNKYMQDGFRMIAFVMVGIYLVIVFFINFLLVLYYKQLAEGYEDAEQFKKLNKIGLTKDEIKNTVNKQVIIFFFLPVVVATLHFAVSGIIIRTFGLFFGVVDKSLIQTIILISFLAFLVVYFIAYLFTAKKYQRIILSRNKNLK